MFMLNMDSNHFFDKLTKLIPDITRVVTRDGQPFSLEPIDQVPLWRVAQRYNLRLPPRRNFDDIDYQQRIFSMRLVNSDAESYFKFISKHVTLNLCQAWKRLFGEENQTTSSIFNGKLVAQMCITDCVSREYWSYHEKFENHHVEMAEEMDIIIRMLNKRNFIKYGCEFYEEIQGTEVFKSLYDDLKRKLELMDIKLANRKPTKLISIEVGYVGKNVGVTYIKSKLGLVFRLVCDRVRVLIAVETICGSIYNPFIYNAFPVSKHESVVQKISNLLEADQWNKSKAGKDTCMMFPIPDDVTGTGISESPYWSIINECYELENNFVYDFWKQVEVFAAQDTKLNKASPDFKRFKSTLNKTIRDPAFASAADLSKRMRDLNKLNVRDKKLPIRGLDDCSRTKRKQELRYSLTSEDLVSGIENRPPPPNFTDK